jgi:hypothetical protein
VTEDIVADKVVHFELPADNLERAQNFYRNAFDWSINTLPRMGYTRVQTTPSGKDGSPTQPGAIIILLGMHPQYGHSPPTSSFSMAGGGNHHRSSGLEGPTVDRHGRRQRPGDAADPGSGRRPLLDQSASHRSGEAAALIDR